MTRLRELGLTPMWDENPERAGRRRIRMAFGLPFWALAGIAWGVSTAPVIGSGSGAFWSVIGAGAMSAFIYLEERVALPLAEALARRGGLGHWGAAVLEAIMIGGFILVLTRLLGVPGAPGVEVALGFAAFYTTTLEFLLRGAPDGIARLLGAGTGGPPRRVGGHSRIGALTARGAWGEAIEECRVQISERPGAPGGYLRLHRVLVARKDYKGAVDVLERCYDRARMSADQEEFVVRRVAELSTTHLDDPDRAVLQVSEWLDRRPEIPAPEWAERMLADLVDLPSDDDGSAGG